MKTLPLKRRFNHNQDIMKNTGIRILFVILLTFPWMLICQEDSQGVKTLHIKDDPRGEGLNFSIKYPSSMSLKKGVHPHVLRVLNKEGQMIQIDITVVNMLKKTDDETMAIIRKAAMEEYGDSSNDNVAKILDNMIMDKEIVAGFVEGISNGKLIDIKDAKMDSLPSKIIVFKGDLTKVNVTMQMYCTSCIIPYKGVFINISLKGAGTTMEEAKKNHDNALADYWSILLSFCLENQWLEKIKYQPNIIGESSIEHTITKSNTNSISKISTNHSDLESTKSFMATIQQWRKENWGWNLAIFIILSIASMVFFLCVLPAQYPKLFKFGRDRKINTRAAKIVLVVILIVCSQPSHRKAAVL